MRPPTQAKRNEVSESYAKALVELADEKGKLEAVHADVDAIAGLLQNNAKLNQLLMNPVVDADKKRALLAKIGKEAGFNTYTNNFLNLLVEKDRLSLLEEIVEEFETLYCKLTDTQVRARACDRGSRCAPHSPFTRLTPRAALPAQVATLRSAVKLEQEQQFLIAKKLQELTGSKNIKMKPVIDTSLIAGFVVEYGSSQIDLSVRGQLEKVSEELSV